MDILIKDGVKYFQTDFHGKELLFEKVVFSQYKHLFGENAILFTKKKISTATGIGTIPDAFVVDFEKEKWFIIEVEISNHDVYSHIVPQLTKFSSALNNPQTRKQLVKFFESEIKADASKIDLLVSNGKKEVFKTVSEIVDSNPELIIIIEQQHDELTSIFNLLPFKGKINVFKTFTQEGFEEGDSIFQIEPIFKERRQTRTELISSAPKTIKEKSTDISESIEAIKSYQELVNNGEIKIGRIAFHFFTKLAEDGKLNKLYDNDPDRKINSFNILKRVRKDDINNAKREKGVSRYYSKAFVDNGVYYLLCSQWYDKHISILKDIIKELSLN